MAFAIRHHEPLDVAVHRVVFEQLDGALEKLRTDTGEVDKNIHEVRKHMKRLRAVLRMIRWELGEETFRKENACFRDAARELASARAAAAMLGSFDTLAKEAAGERTEALRKELTSSRGRAVESALEVRCATAIAMLEASRRRSEKWQFRRADWDVVSTGFRRTYGRAVRGLRKARAKPTTRHFHDWRKWTKHHFYQVQLFEPTWPSVLSVRRRELKDLSELLGDEHDLADLRGALLSGSLDLSLDPALPPLLSRLDRRRETLRAEALRAGRRLFAEAPRAIDRRFAAYFKVWDSAPDEEVERDVAEAAPVRAVPAWLPVEA